MHEHGGEHRLLRGEPRHVGPAAELAGRDRLDLRNRDLDHEVRDPDAIPAEVLRGRKESESIVAPHAGANLWVMKHNFNLKTDVGFRRTEIKNEPTKKDVIWTTQG